MNTRLPQVVQRLQTLAKPAADSSLLEAFLHRRDDDAFAELMRRHGPMVYSTCRRLLGDAHAADDAFQATFLILARKAGAVRSQSSAAPWLYGVACRVARKALRSAYRRRSHESRAAPAEPAGVDAAWEELRLLLDEELNRLPDKLRVPLILCYLQGQTRDEAALQLGCSFGALKRRLEDGRTLLRNRLVRRGVTLGLTGLAAAVNESPAPAALIENTLRLINGSPLPQAVAELLPAALARRAKFILGAALLGMVITGAAVLSARKPAEVARAVPKAEPPKQPEIKRDWFNDRLPEGAVARLGTTAFAHGDSFVRHVAFSADGRQVLSMGFSLVCVFDAKSGQLLAEFPRPGNQGSWVGGAFTGEGTVCLVRDDAVARVYDVATRRETRTFDLNGEGRKKQVLQVAFTPDGNSLAVLEADDGIRIWDVAASHRGRLLSTEGKTVRLFALAHGVKSVAALDEDGNIRVWSMATGQQLTKFAAGARDFRYFAVSPDGNWVATVGQTRTEHNEGRARYTTFETDGHVELWDVTKGTSVRRIDAHPKGIGAIQFARDCHSIYTSGYGLDPFARRWDLKTGKKLMETLRVGNAVTALDISADGKSLAACSQGVLRIYNAETGKESVPIDAHRTAVTSVVLLPNGRALTGGGEGDLREWDLMTGKPLGRFPVQQGYAYDVSRAPDGRLAVISFSHENPEVRIVDSAGKLLRTLKGKGKAIGSIAFSTDGSVLAAADYGANVILWDAQTGREIRILKSAGKYGPRMLRFSADGKRLFGASIDDAFCIWDVATGERTQTWDPFALGLMKKNDDDHAERAMGLAFSHDLKHVALGIQGEARLLVCEVETGKLVESLPRLPGTPVSIAFSPDGKTIAYGTWEGPVHLYERRSGKKLAEFTGHRGRVLDLVFTEDSRHLVSASDDTSALVWAVPN